MSTKTTFKRIALATVAAMGFGVIPLTPASAAVTAGTFSTSTGTTVTTAAIAPSSTLTTRVTYTSGAETAAGVWTGTAANTTYSWRILEHSSTITPNAYYGTGANNLSLPSTNTSGHTFLLQIATASTAVAGSTIVLTLGGTSFTVTVATAGSGLVAPSVSNATDTPWRIDDAFTGESTTITSNANLASLTAGAVVTSTASEVRIKAAVDTVQKVGTGSYRYVEVTGSTIKNVAGGAVIDGVVNSATRAVLIQSGVVTGTEVHINATAAGTVTAKFYDRSIIALTGATQDTLLQTITFTVTAPGALSAQQSTAFIAAKHNSATGVATDAENPALAFTADQVILAPATLGGVGGLTSIAGTAKAVIQVNLKDAAGAPLVGTLPAVGATISGPGTLSMGIAADADGSTGRSLADTAADAATFYINVFSDGTSGTSTISILVGGAVWKTKTMKFYTTPTTVTATQGLKVLKANTVSGCAVGTVLSPSLTVTDPLTECDDSSVASTVAVKVVTTDANGIPVPFRSFKAVSSDATVLVGAATGATPSTTAHYLGANWYTVASTFGAASGTSATLTYTTALTSTTDLSSGALKFAIGGAPVSASLAISTGSNVGDKGTMTISVKDASGNATYDADHTLALTSSTALTTALGQIAATGNPIAVIDGKSTIDFFNPLVAGTVSVTGLISGALPVSGSFTVTNSSIDAAVDAAAEAIDAANAATDAANLAAEAADAATVAAEEARDAADAATAAIEELATQVATLMAALKAQITTLANTVAKIAKKVKA